MTCRKCPHLVRHGKLAADNKNIEFRSRCGLKREEEVDCHKLPFPKIFDYLDCENYRATFKSSIQRNDVVPTRDIQYSEKVAASGLSNLELL